MRTNPSSLRTTAQRMIYLLDQLSGHGGHGEYCHFKVLWCHSTTSPKSVVQAANHTVASTAEDRDRALALECERIAGDPELLANAIADYPQAIAGSKLRDKRLGAASYGR